MENSVRKEAKPGRGNDIRRWFFSMSVNIFAYVAVIRATREPYLKIICKSSQKISKKPVDIPKKP